MIVELNGSVGSELGIAVIGVEDGVGVGVVVGCELSLDVRQRDVAADTQIFIRPMQILAHLDLGNYQLVPYLVKSAKSWMKRGKLSDPEVDLFFSLTYAIAKAPESKRKGAWVKLKEAAATQKMERINKEIHLSRWMEQKLKR